MHFSLSFLSADSFWNSGMSNNTLPDMYLFHRFLHLQHRSWDPGQIRGEDRDSAGYHTHSGLLIPHAPGTNHLIQNHVPNLDMGFSKRTKGTFTGSLCLFPIFMTQVVAMIFIKYVIEFVISSNKGTFGANNNQHWYHTTREKIYQLHSNVLHLGACCHLLAEANILVKFCLWTEILVVKS